MLMPQAAIAQSIATAALPTFSAQVARGRLEHMRVSLAATLRGVLLLAIPTSLGLILLRQPLVQLLFQQGGAFNDQSTQMVTWALLWYGAGLVGHCIVEIISRAFYALHDTRTPVMVGIAAMSMNLVFSLAFSALFRSIDWLPHGGLALANSLATAIESAILIVIMRKRLRGLEGKSIISLVLKALLAALLMSIAVWAWLSYSEQFSSSMVALGGILVGAIVYGIVVSLADVQEITILWGSFRRKLNF